eukprot:scaffold105467_cov49-Phaeocystis_antarctica.AAC.1
MIAVAARIPHMQRLLVRHASQLRAGIDRGRTIRGLSGVGRGQGGRSRAQRACCVVAIFCWRPIWPFENARGVSFTCVGV